MIPLMLPSVNIIFQASPSWRTAWLRQSTWRRVRSLPTPRSSLLVWGLHPSCCTTTPQVGGAAREDSPHMNWVSCNNFFVNKNKLDSFGDLCGSEGQSKKRTSSLFSGGIKISRSLLHVCATRATTQYHCTLAVVACAARTPKQTGSLHVLCGLQCCEHWTLPLSKQGYDVTFNILWTMSGDKVSTW